ncbi:MAG: calcium/sodium antiporter [Deltaproteobacteria bacterium]
MAMQALTFGIGVAFLIIGADLLVRGGSGLAAALRITPVVIGLTVAAFGTGTPELAVSVNAALWGKPEIALGNAVGSNIVNILLVLGLAGVTTPMLVSRRLMWRDVPVMIGVSVLVLLLGLEGRIARAGGLLMIGGFVAYTYWSVREGRKGTAHLPAPRPVKRPDSEAKKSLPAVRCVLLIAVGLCMLAFGARWVVTAAVAFARLLKFSELTIGLVILAPSTSLPEIATTVIAALRKQKEIAIGNIVGSNIFNILIVLGVAAVMAPRGLIVPPAALRFDIPVMIASATVCLPIFITGREIARWEGGLLLFYYAAYLLYLLIGASHHEILPAFSIAMMAFVMPLTVLALLFSFLGRPKNVAPFKKSDRD